MEDAGGGWVKLFGWYGGSEGDGHMERTITREELEAKMERGDDFVLVDALSPRYYEGVHLPGAVNLPLESIGEAHNVLPDRGRRSSSTA